MRSDAEIFADGSTGRPLQPGEQSRWEYLVQKSLTENRNAQRESIFGQQGQAIDQQYAQALEFIRQFPQYKDVAYQGLGEQDIQQEYDRSIQNIEAATNPYVSGTSGNLAANELARQQSGAARRGLLGASGSINQGAQLQQQANVQQAQARQAFGDQRFVRRQSLGTALTGLAQYNQGNKYQSELQKALQGLSTYGDYYAKPKNAILQQRLGFAEKDSDYAIAQNDSRRIADEGVARTRQAQENASGNDLLGTAIGIGSKLFGL